MSIDKVVHEWDQVGSEIKEGTVERKLQEMRQLSNVIQALENLLVQCDELPQFSSLRVVATEALILATSSMTSALHREA